MAFIAIDFLARLLLRLVLQREAISAADVNDFSSKQWPSWALYLSVAVVCMLGLGGISVLSYVLIRTLAS